MEPTNFLTELSWLSIVLLSGIIISIIAKKIRFPEVLALVLIGVLIGQLDLITFNTRFLAGFSIFALIMIIFESSSKFKPKEIAKYSPAAIKLALIFIFLTTSILGTVTVFLLFQERTVQTILLSALFGALMGGTSSCTMLSLLKDKNNKVMEILKFESILNTPFVVLIPIMILEFLLGSFQAGEIISRFLQSIMAGLGAGLVIGLILTQFMKRYYMKGLSPLITIAGVFISYTTAEYLKGSGILAVTMVGIIFGYTQIKQKEELMDFAGLFTNFLRIVVFLLLGLIIKLPLQDQTLLKNSLILFGVLLVIRYFSVKLALKNTHLTRKEIIFMTLNSGKGISEAVVAFILVALLPEISGLANIINTILLSILYSIIIASLTGLFTKWLVKSHTNNLHKSVA